MPSLTLLWNIWSKGLSFGGWDFKSYFHAQLFSSNINIHDMYMDTGWRQDLYLNYQMYTSELLYSLLADSTKDNILCCFLNFSLITFYKGIENC